MRRSVLALFATLALALGLSASASAAANPTHANCFALFVSDQPAGDVGSSASSNAKDPEARPLGLNVVSFTAHLRQPDCFE